MLPHDTRRKIKNITAGTLLEGQSDYCTAARNFLCGSYPTSTTVKTDFESKAIVKEEQARLLKKFSTDHHLWLSGFPDEKMYLTRGGEARVYLDSDGRHVIKCNDAVYYATWLEFLNSIVLHNLIFQNTAYELLGFTSVEGILYAVLKQPFIISYGRVELEDIETLLEFNGFENSRRNDYVHKELGLILEDMHDENVLLNSNTLFFIDTVFFTITPAN
ncbi:MAG: hypothetical protein ACTHMV_12515 [Chitinophagaceae bacterium]